MKKSYYVFLLFLIVFLFLGCNSTPKIESIATEQSNVGNNSDPTEVRGTACTNELCILRRTV